MESGATPTPYIPALVKKKLILPERNNSTYKVERYLKSRGIHPKVIWHCIRSNPLYESRKYHNAVFVGYNKQHEPKYAALRSTFASFKGEASGSDKTYSFRVEGYSNASKLHVFEAAIDLLSLASIKELRGENWLNDHYLSLGGISQSSVRNGLPKGLDNYLMHHSDIETICLHLDNDEPGRNAAAAERRADPPSGRDPGSRQPGNHRTDSRSSRSPVDRDES